MKYFSLFTGVGGFELGINKAYEDRIQNSRSNKTMSNADSEQHLEMQQPEPICVGYSEIDKYAISVYQYHYQSHKNYGDITQIDWNTVPDFDLVVGGSPCQDLSVAGKQKGLSGARSGLFFEFVRCLKEKQPTNFIWENVKGALSSSSGWDFGRVQIEFSEAGYDVEWQVLNAKDFGVPQNRERVFVVGHLRGKSQPKVFPIRTSPIKADGECDQSFIDLSTLNPKITEIARTIQQRYAKGYSHHAGEVSGVIAWSKSHRTGKGETDKRRKNYGQIEQRIKLNGEFNTLSAGDGGGNQSTKNFIAEDTKIRRLTPLETERLMSWPDNWTKEPNISDTQRYKMCGNGVVSNVVQEIIKRLYYA